MEREVFTYEEAFAKSLEYFGGDELAAKVFVDKYALRDNEGNILERTPEDMHRRLAKEFARIERKKFRNTEVSPLTEEEIFSYFDRFGKIIPQGSPMYAIGNDYQFVTCSNCYLLESPLDSYSSILMVDEQLVNISKRRGGVGICLDNLRPAGTPTRNAARSSTGIVSFMERYSASIREVGQSGRRGALLLSLSVHHPQVVDFATAKRDLTKVTGANISVTLSNEFLEAVEKDEEYEQRFPVNSPNPRISRKVRAREVWDKIIQCAWETAEPGLLFWDNILDYTPTTPYEEYKSVGTNPCCFAKDTEVFVVTKSGVKEIKNVTSEDLVWIDSEKTWAPTSGYFSAGEQEVYEVLFSNGTSLTITPNHKLASVESKRVGTRVVRREGPMKELRDFKEGDLVALSVNPSVETINKTSKDYHLGLVLGWLSGDGRLSYRNEKEPYPTMYLPCRDVGAKLQESSKLLGCELELQANRHNKTLSLVSTEFVKDYVEETQKSIWYFRSKICPNPYLEEATDEFLSGFLSALFSADGTVGKVNIQLASVNKSLLLQVRSILSKFGITSGISLLRKADSGKYTTRDCYRLSITGKSNLDKFYKYIGFVSDAKQKRLQEIVEGEPKRQPKLATYTKIKSIRPAGKKIVGCIEVPGYHKFTANGIISGNSEIVLSPLDSCRLMLLNLFSYVRNPFTRKAYFDFEEFSKDARICQRLQDDMVDLEAEKIESIIKKIKSDPEPDRVKHRELLMWKRILRFNNEGRRTGTGVTALGDTIAALGLKYASAKSIEVTEEIYKTLKLSCYRESVELAKVLGPFVVWDHEKEKTNKFIQRIKQDDPNLYKEMATHGRRNIALLTTAPAGSVSILSQTTSGIEPLFMLGYIRRKKINPADKQARVDFVDQNGDAWQNFTVYHPKVKLWMEITGEEDPTKSPWHGSCAEELDWPQRVRLQAAAQRHVDHSISSTLNLPEDVTVDQVKQIYETAWKSGVKGITVYRKNCRTGVLVEQQKPNGRGKSIQYTHAPTRPKKLKGELHFTSIKGENYYVVVGLLEDKPYEVFVGRNSIPPKRAVLDGIVEKKSRGHYNAIFGDINLENVGSNCSDEEESLTRMTSTSLRHGAEVAFVVHQLEKTKGGLQSPAKAIARALKKYIEDGRAVTGEECPSCNSPQLQRSEGCVLCKACGWTRC